MKRRTALTAATLGLVGLAGLGLANAQGSWTGWHGRRDRHGPHGGFEAWCGPGGAERMEAGLDGLRAELALRADQEAAWDGLATAVRAATARMAATCRSATQDLAAPDRLTQAEAMLATGLAGLRDIRPAFDALYGVLDDGQRRRLDGMVRHGA